MTARSGDSLQNNYPAEINELRGSSGPTRLENADMDASRSPYYELRCSSTTVARLDALTSDQWGGRIQSDSGTLPLSRFSFALLAPAGERRSGGRSSPREHARAPPPPKLKPGRWFGERRSGGCARSLKSQPSLVPQEKNAPTSPTSQFVSRFPQPWVVGRLAFLSGRVWPLAPGLHASRRVLAKGLSGSRDGSHKVGSCEWCLGKYTKINRITISAVQS
ncbi:conserved hypothetical protein [Coccidioides posadasii str. Silveira]|uniref:Uncharacterized protein n=1 Tax=Coccidioides posadasii (strain RMSCC 757 / Silveira) TaxID=443226 RepID=E9DBX6_COCPS|nr:conserved hypothetical protein [Coccidioides posadasii str. Silveira]